MLFFRRTGRSRRDRCRPRLEGLEVRCLLDASSSLGLTIAVEQVATRSEPQREVLWQDSLINASAARVRFGVDGSGLTAAIIDTGSYFDHPAFASDAAWRLQQDFVNDGLAPSPDALRHGTAVAGLLAATDPSRPGVAPGANLLGLRVFNDQGAGDFEAIGNALQWVIDHHQDLNISVVNISIVDGRNYHPSYMPSGEAVDRIQGLVGQLKDLRIPVVAAAGNRFDGRQGMGFLAILEETISVTATDAGDRPMASAQRLGKAVGGSFATDLAAPGVGMSAPVGIDGFTTVEGTSFAAPLVSGAVLLLQELYKSRFGVLPTVDEVAGWLQAGSEPVNDPTTKIVLNRLDIERSAMLVPEPAAMASPAPGPLPGPAAVPAAQASRPFFQALRWQERAAASRIPLRVNPPARPRPTPLPTRQTPTPPQVPTRMGAQPRPALNFLLSARVARFGPEA